MINKNLPPLPVLALVLFSWYHVPVAAQDASPTIDKLRAVANAVLKDATFLFVDEKTGKHFRTPAEAPQEAQLHLESRYNDWRYWNGVLNLSMMRLGELLHEPTYTDFAFKNIAFNFDNYRYFEAAYKGQRKWDYPFGQRFIMEELDDCGAMGASVIEVYSREQQPRYRAYIDSAAGYILTRQHRLEDGTFVRPFPLKWTLWVDDLYMSVSFLARMGELTHEERYFDVAARQVVNFHKHLFDENAGLMHHCWYSDVNRPGVAFWGRGNGWAMLAQVDLLDRLPKNHPERDTLLLLLQRHTLGVAQYQSAEGLWHQLLDKEDSYLETSCTAMFAYAIARAVNRGYIEPRYASIAQRAWEGVLSRIHTDGQVEGVCAGTGVGDDLVHYYHRPTPLNDVHGIGAVLLAGAEVLQLPK
jgi:rhamnogalacturonyl hydrolase YesR